MPHQMYEVTIEIERNSTDPETAAAEAVDVIRQGIELKAVVEDAAGERVVVSVPPTEPADIPPP